MSGPRWLRLDERDRTSLDDSDDCPTRQWWVRADAIDAVVCSPSRNAVDAEVYIRGRAKPILVCEQGDDILAEIGVFEGRCRVCLDDMPGADEYGGFCKCCERRIAEAGR